MGNWKTPIVDLGEYCNNHLWIKREDLIPFSFGGNKARKAELFFKEIVAGGYDSVVTYGSSSSNHCRVVANECCRRGIKCYIACPFEASKQTFNSQMIKLFGAEIRMVHADEAPKRIDEWMEELRFEGKKPYNIWGGGHGNIGTEAYVQCYHEIKEQEKNLGVYFDSIFFASGTGTTQAGLVCGQLLAGDDRKIIGISIARNNPAGREAIIDSIRDYLDVDMPESDIQKATIFLDDYMFGYGKYDEHILEVVETVMKKYGIPLDTTYTGKAFSGMTEYIKETQIKKKNILFIHTGGTPLFFDGLRKDIYKLKL